MVLLFTLLCFVQLKLLFNYIFVNFQANKVSQILYSLIGEKDLKLIATSFKDNILNGLTCKSVQIIVSIGKFKVINKNTLSKIIAKFCTNFGRQSKKVCNGVGNLFAPPVKYILENTKLTSKEIASVVVGHKCIKEKDRLKSGALNWKVNIPPPKSSLTLNLNENSISNSNSKLTNESSFQFLHFTDLHLDLEFSTGSEVNCNEPVCCRSDANKVAKGLPSKNSTKWGDTDGNCDSSFNLIDESFKHISQTVEKSDGKIKYAIWTGKFKQNVNNCTHVA